MKLVLSVFCLLLASNLIAQKSALEDLLWKEAGGRIDTSEDHGGRYEIVDDAENGYLKIAFTEDGCGCYSETTVAAYKGHDGKYTTLKMYWDGCQNIKSLSSNKGLISVLPEDMGLHTFWPETGVRRDNDNQALLYLEAYLPKKGTDTQLDLKYVPFGICTSGEDNVLSFSGYNETSNFGYNESLKLALEKYVDSTTFKHIINNEPNKIRAIDKNIVATLYGDDKNVKDFKSLSSLFTMLENYHEVSKQITYKSVVLGWNRNTERFYIKEKVKNDTPKLSFLEFVKQLPFLAALC